MSNKTFFKFGVKVSFTIVGELSHTILEEKFAERKLHEILNSENR